MSGDRAGTDADRGASKREICRCTPNAIANRLAARMGAKFVPIRAENVDAADALQLLSEALFNFSASVNELGLLTNEVAHARYEQVVSAYQALDAAIAQPLSGGSQ